MNVSGLKYFHLKSMSIVSFNLACKNIYKDNIIKTS